VTRLAAYLRYGCWVRQSLLIASVSVHYMDLSNPRDSRSLAKTTLVPSGANEGSPSLDEFIAEIDLFEPSAFIE